MPNINPEEIDQSNGVYFEECIEKWIFKSPSNLKSSNNKYENEFDNENLYAMTENEEKFILQLVNEIYYLVHGSIPKQTLLIQIAILWGKYSHDKERHSPESLSQFTIEMFKQYLATNDGQ